MACMGSFDCGDMRQLQRELEKLKVADDAFLEACAKELAARLLRKVVKRTPVGTYAKSTGKHGGNLRRGWMAESLSVSHIGESYVVEIRNPVEYASYVEYGHRTRDHKKWVHGRFMMKISEQEIQESAPQILESKIRKFMGDAFR